MMWTFGLGMEIKLPVPKADIRIPLTLRGSYNPGVEAKAIDRLDGTPTASKATFKTEWQWNAAATLGVAYYFL